MWADSPPILAHAGGPSARPHGPARRVSLSELFGGPSSHNACSESVSVSIWTSFSLQQAAIDVLAGRSSLAVAQTLVFRDAYLT